MGDNRKDEPTQRTEKGLEIPIPTRDEFMKNLEKVAKPKDGSPKVEDAARQEVEYLADETIE